MEKKKCKHCNRKVLRDHYCVPLGRTVYYNNDRDFLSSFVASSVTGDPLIGMAVGGDPLGAMLGAGMHEDDSCKSGHSGSDASDSSSSDSSDSGSSDSGGCGGGGE